MLPGPAHCMVTSALIPASLLVILQISVVVVLHMTAVHVILSLHRQLDTEITPRKT